ncbi:ABC transporter permease [Bacteroides sp. 224]|uniref:ABC transporter permease n=1 Tax=Bacteroides sp. 224 TaxID=2302936 RepID=UPI0013D22D6E|nr:FtsX-like permease family protein [Bacteroides sp. 224]NDV64467.1 ABC transporter permease [Bacteroides sp. 224]
MLYHYIKIAVRNLLKYKTQSIISILGLAIGFTFFALSMLWIHYELTYDSFHDGADRIYLVQMEDMAGTRQTTTTTHALAAYLKETFPEIESSSNNHHPYMNDVIIDGIKQQSCIMFTNERYLDMFDIKTVEGSIDFLAPNSKKIAITQQAAARFFGDESPIGKEVSSYGTLYTISAIITGWSEHSNMYYDFISGYEQASYSWGYASWITYIKLKKGEDFEKFATKLAAHEIRKEHVVINSLTLLPLSKLHYSGAMFILNVKFNHLIIFSIVSALIIFCALFNYLTIFVSRLYMRLRETALRKICGSTNGSLFMLYSVELLIILLLSTVIGMAFLEIALPAFKELSSVSSTKGEIYLEAIGYMFVIVLIALLIVRFSIYYVNKRALYLSIKETSDGRRRNIFRKSSIMLQLIVGLGIMFCSVVMIKQLQFWKNTDIGMERKNSAMFGALFPIKNDVLVKKVTELPMVTDMIEGSYPLIGRPKYYEQVVNWEGKPEDAESFQIELIETNEEYLKFHGLVLLEGEMLSDKSPKESILLNEKAVKVLGWHKPIGKKILDKTVIGVIKDFYLASYSTPSTPIGFVLPRESEYTYIPPVVLFKYQENTWSECKKIIEEWMKQEYKNESFYIRNIEEVYDEALKSENALLTMLIFVAFVCMLISVFGVFSLITLTCEQRRKEIAIRKVNGAKRINILLMFFDEYFVLLVIASVIAFSVGYFIMSSWIESFILQTEISWWIYAVIFCFTLLVLALTILWRVWKAAVQNPAEVIKSE